MMLRLKHRKHRQNEEQSFPMMRTGPRKGESEERGENVAIATVI
jgi:hypothetical protein